MRRREGPARPHPLRLRDGPGILGVFEEAAMIPARFAPMLFGLVLSGLMSPIVSGIATLRAAGTAEGFGALWMGSWLSSWVVAFPTALVVAPLTRRTVGRMIRPAEASPTD